jgi:hypothetical protein
MLDFVLPQMRGYIYKALVKFLLVLQRISHTGQHHTVQIALLSLSHTVCRWFWVSSFSSSPEAFSPLVPAELDLAYSPQPSRPSWPSIPFCQRWDLEIYAGLEGPGPRFAMVFDELSSPQQTDTSCSIEQDMALRWPSSLYAIDLEALAT